MIVEDDKLKSAVLVALADNEMVAILRSCTPRAKSVIDIIKEMGMPHTTAYRKMNWLVDNGLVVTERIQVTQDGKKFSLFRSVIRSVTTKYDYSMIDVKVEYSIDVAEKTAAKLLSLDQ